MTLKRKSIKRSFVMLFIISLLFSLLQFHVFNYEKVEANSNYKIVGYYPSWGAYGRDYQVWDMDVSKVTHINYAFADICWDGRHGNPDPTGPNPTTWTCQDENGTIDVPNGSIVLGDPWIDVQKSNPGDTWDEPIKGNIKQLNLLKEQNPHLKTMISVGGWTWSNRFSDAAASQITRENFANSAVDFLRKYQFDGVDLDWEYPVSGGLPGNSTRPEDKQNYTLLLQEVREKLNIAGAEDGKYYSLTIASGAGPTYAQNTELDKIANVVDWINIMTYDFNGGWQTISAHNSPLYFDPAAASSNVPNAAEFNIEAGVQGHINAGVPAQKIVIGTPFYGRGWSSCSSDNNGEYQSCSAANDGTWENGVWDYTDLEDNYINKNGYVRYWNDVAKVPFLYNASNGNFITYDDVESFGYKTDFIKSNGLGGAMFWEFSGDRNKVLLNKLTSDLDSGGVPDNEAPTVPSNLRVTSKTSSSISLVWDASTDNVGVTGYIVTYGNQSINVGSLNATISGLAPNTSYTFTVKAKDAAGNVSVQSNAITETTEQSNDTTPPTIPTNLQVTAKTFTSVDLSWSASTDNEGVTGYTVSYDLGTVEVTETSVSINGLTADTTYTFTVTAKDAAGNISDETSIQVTTESPNSCPYPAWDENTEYAGGMRVTYNGKVYESKWWTVGEFPDQSDEWGVWKYISTCDGGGGEVDNEAPSIPSNLQITGKSSNSVSLAWDASTDNVGVTGYTITYDLGSVEVTNTTTTINGLSAETTYTFSVTAKDSAGNESEAVSIQATTDEGDPSGAEPWEAGVNYSANDEVTYNGNTYYCIQAHTSQIGWEPPNVPALWGLK
ncbi:glycosyl hydrolase family 18 protein [Chengkuizengella sediminis]|uniref:glycosyl hydrolase family 18 protein n=1 Tax=Chengkuizengella sediminis TaxID=1885917 RepID=UPI00138A0E7E|nr:glycosyl hydrolase family 18 protein [Chengkuizengella sediminis]NDI35829.1 chitinase [Chengkuizengella sediminis]